MHFVQRLRMREQSPEHKRVQAPALDFVRNNDLEQVSVVVSAGHHNHTFIVLTELCYNDYYY